MPSIHDVCREFLTTEVVKLKRFFQYHQIMSTILSEPTIVLEAQEKSLLQQTLKPFEEIAKLVGDNPEAYLREHVGMSFSAKNSQGQEQDNAKELAYKLLNYLCSPLFSKIRTACAVICNQMAKIEKILQANPIFEQSRRELQSCLIMSVQVVSNATLYTGRLQNGLSEIPSQTDGSDATLREVVDVFISLADNAGKYVNFMSCKEIVVKEDGSLQEILLSEKDPRFVYGTMINQLAGTQHTVLNELFQSRVTLDAKEQICFDRLLQLGFAYLSELHYIIDAGPEANSQRTGVRKAMQVQAKSGDALQTALERQDSYQSFQATYDNAEIKAIFDKLLDLQKTMMKPELRHITTHLWNYRLAWFKAMQHIVSIEGVEYQDNRYRLPTSHIPVAAPEPAAPSMPRVLGDVDLSKTKRKGSLFSRNQSPTSPRKKESDDVRNRAGSAGTLLQGFRKKIGDAVRSLSQGEESKKDSIIISPPTSPRSVETTTLTEQSLFASPPTSPREGKTSDPLIEELRSRLLAVNEDAISTSAPKS